MSDIDGEVCDCCERGSVSESREIGGQRRDICTDCATLSGTDDEDVWVHPVTESDLELILAWRSIPSVYEWSRSQDEPLDWETHVQWFQTRPASREDFVIHYVDRRVGVVSVGASGFVSIYLGDLSARGYGIATRALQWLCSRFADERQLYAEIHHDNDSSVALFERCGFVSERRDDEWLVYAYHGEWA